MTVDDTLLDWIQFLDIFCELYADPFYEKRYWCAAPNPRPARCSK